MLPLSPPLASEIDRYEQKRAGEGAEDLPLLFLTLHTYEMLPGNDPELSCDEKR